MPGSDRISDRLRRAAGRAAPGDPAPPGAGEAPRGGGAEGAGSREDPRARVTEEELEAHEREQEEAGLGRERRWGAARKAAGIALACACAYVILLIFGVFMTEFRYTDEGGVAPEVLTVEDRREKNAFEVIQAQYENCRLLYEQALVLDYRVGQGIENYMAIAPEYEALLDEVTNISVKTEALAVETQYSQVKSLLLAWIQDDIAVYLQNMAAGLSQSSEETLGNALTDRERVYYDFYIITQNMLALGEGLKGVDLAEAREWTPDGYVDGYINGTGG